MTGRAFFTKVPVGEYADGSTRWAWGIRFYSRTRPTCGQRVEVKRKDGSTSTVAIARVIQCVNGDSWWCAI